jgi:hypothetical protein
MRSLVFSACLLLATVCLAQTTQFDVEVSPLIARVDVDAVARFETRAGVFSGASPSQVTVRYVIDGDATFDRIEGEGSCTIDGKTALCTRQDPFARFDVFLRPIGNGAQATLSMSATSPEQTSPTAMARSTVQSYYAIIVDRAADAGPGTLRAAIEEANAVGKPAKILFHLPPPIPAGGWYTIVPETPLPPITVVSMVLDGTEQTRFSGDTNPRGPEIAIDGHLAHYGLEIHSRCEAKVAGLVLGNFDANQGLWFTKSGPCNSLPYTVDGERWVTDNYIGTDPTGTVAWPNLRGVRADFGAGDIRDNVISGNTYSGMWCWQTFGNQESLNVDHNRFGTAADGVTPLPNGAAGMLFGPRVSADVRRNIIANHPGMGIALSREGETYVEIRENSMRDNGGIGIDWGVDGVSPRMIDDGESYPNAPLMLAGRYEAATNRTYFSLTSNNRGPAGPNGFGFRFDFYANRTADGDGEQWLDPIGYTADEYWFPGDLRGKWIVATTTRYPVFGAKRPRLTTQSPGLGDARTSELSNAVLVE